MTFQTSFLKIVLIHKEKGDLMLHLMTSKVVLFLMKNLFNHNASMLFCEKYDVNMIFFVIGLVQMGF